jgi:hypothetical protein
MKSLLLGIVIGLCIIAFVKASNPFDSRQVVWLPATYGTVNGHGYQLGLAPDGNGRMAQIRSLRSRLS